MRPGTGTEMPPGGKRAVELSPPPPAPLLFMEDELQDIQVLTVVLTIYSVAMTLMCWRQWLLCQSYKAANKARAWMIEETRAGKPPFLLNRGVSIVILPSRKTVEADIGLPMVVKSEEPGDD